MFQRHRPLVTRYVRASDSNYALIYPKNHLNVPAITHAVKKGSIRESPARPGTIAPSRVVHLSRLRRCRLEAALTQEELADRAGVSRRAVALIERGETEPRPSTIRKLADALGCSPRDLMEPESASAPPSA